jgi:hypothetical protein
MYLLVAVQVEHLLLAPLLQLCWLITAAAEGVGALMVQGMVQLALVQLQTVLVLVAVLLNRVALIMVQQATVMAQGVMAGYRVAGVAVVAVAQETTTARLVRLVLAALVTAAGHLGALLSVLQQLPVLVVMVARETAGLLLLQALLTRVMRALAQVAMRVGTEKPAALASLAFVTHTHKDQHVSFCKSN